MSHRDNRSSNSKIGLPNPFIHVTNLNDSGDGSLRQAILDSTLDLTIINFQVSGVIKLLSDLPHVTKKTIFNGKSVPNFTDKPLIEIDFNQNNGLVFKEDSHESEIYFLSLTNSRSDAILLLSNKISLDGNWIGISLESRSKGSNGNGITSLNSQNHKIGLNSMSISSYTSNFISNNKNGIALINSLGVIIASNAIGVNPKQNLPMPNFNGIFLKKSEYNLIGGEVYINSDGKENNPTGSEGRETPVFIIPPLGNLISGNLENGIYLEDSRFNQFSGNFIGTSEDGNFSLGNKTGILLENSDFNDIIGCKINNNPFVYYNVVSGNKENGLKVFNSNNLKIQANFFGIGANNSVKVPNGLNGVSLEGYSQRIKFGGVIPLGNNSSGNLKNGLVIKDNVKHTVTFNLFAGIYAFGGEASNGENGILITSDGMNNDIRTCVISGNQGNGIEITGHAKGVNIDPCIIGLSTNGAYSVPNGGNGILIGGYSSDVLILSRKISVILHTIISGNLKSGISIRDNANRILIEDVVIGLDFLMTNAISNQKYGIELRDSIKKIVIAKSNISGNKLNGIIIGKCVNCLKLLKNTIGENRFGFKVPNKKPEILYL